MKREFRRALLADLPTLEAEGWRPAVEAGGAVGCDPWCAGTLATVTVMREVSTCGCLAGSCICELLGLALERRQP